MWHKAALASHNDRQGTLLRVRTVTLNEDRELVLVVLVLCILGAFRLLSAGIVQESVSIQSGEENNHLLPEQPWNSGKNTVDHKEIK